MISIQRDDPTRSDVRKLLADQASDLSAVAPGEVDYVMGPDDLTGAEVAFWTARDDDHLLGCGALLPLGAGEAELRSMRTAPSARRRGVARLLLAQILAHAADAGFRLILLETGAQDFFAPSRSLYEQEGFQVRGPYGDYRESPSSVFMELRLD